MTTSDSKEAFIAWIATFDHRRLQNEDDVETKFVLPLFLSLGYPDTHRRGKYPVSGYQPNRTGRRTEADQIYFSVGEIDQQTPDTALILVEAKRFQKGNLDAAVVQAKYYSNYLKPLLVVVTNGRRILVLKSRLYRSDEIVLDLPIEALRSSSQASAFFELLNFDTVRQLRSQIVDDLMYEQFVHLERTLRLYPDIQTILAAGDFVPQTSQEGRSMIAIQPKVAIEGVLPLGFGQGSCAITFSHVLRRGLTIHLDHRDILGSLSIGMGTSPTAGTRRFLRQESDGSFLIELGRTRTLITPEEAHDLCACIDTFCGAYRSTIYEAENALETWEYPLVPTSEGPGFYLLSVPSWLWESIRQFAEEFDYHNGSTSWHIFERYLPALRVSHKDQDHVFICGLPRLPDTTSFLPEHIHLIYVQHEAIMQRIGDQSGVAWHQSVGVQGLWSALYTAQWLKEALIPAVRQWCDHHPMLTAVDWSCLVAHESEYDRTYTPLRSIQSSEQFVPYLLDVQLWLTSYRTKQIATAALRPMLVCCLQLARRANPLRLNLHYIVSHLGGVEGVDQSDFVSFQYGKDPHKSRDVFATALLKLQTFVDQLHAKEHIDHWAADHVLRSVITILEEGQIAASQVELNQTAQALTNLWQLCRFETRHVWPQTINQGAI
jgi:hypothetical protein